VKNRPKKRDARTHHRLTHIQLCSYERLSLAKIGKKSKRNFSARFSRRRKKDRRAPFPCDVSFVPATDLARREKKKRSYDLKTSPCLLVEMNVCFSVASRREHHESNLPRDCPPVLFGSCAGVSSGSREGRGRIAAQHFLVKVVYASAVPIRFRSFFRGAGERKKMT